MEVLQEGLAQSSLHHGRKILNCNLYLVTSSFIFLDGNYSTSTLPNWQHKFCFWQSVMFSCLKATLHWQFCSFSNTYPIYVHSYFRILKSKFLPKLNQFMPKLMDFWLLETPSMSGFLTGSETQMFWKYLHNFHGNRFAFYASLDQACSLVCRYLSIQWSIMFCLSSSST